MNLYQLKFDGIDYYVEAKSFEDAIRIWKNWGKKNWEGEWDGTESPESLTLVNNAPIIREA